MHPPDPDRPAACGASAPSDRPQATDCPASPGRTLSLVDALLALQPLGALPRTGWIQHGIPAPETIAAHVLGTSLLVLALGPRVVPPLDVDRAAALALVHDVPEALLGDLPRAAARLLAPGAKAAAEERAAALLLGPLSALALERYDEYRRGETREARFAKVCDRLQLGLRALGYQRAGARGLEDFAATLAAADCSEFGPAAEVQREILAALG